MSHRVAFSMQDGRRWRGALWRRALLCGGALVVVFGGFHWSTRTTAVTDLDAALRTDCDAWDRAASEGIAAIIADRSIAAELRLDEAILQLRRARKNCRAGSIALAGHDYASLHQTFPTSTGSVRATSRHAAEETPRMSPPPR
jgi:hypothetical protein